MHFGETAQRPAAREESIPWSSALILNLWFLYCTQYRVYLSGIVVLTNVQLLRPPLQGYIKSFAQM